MKTSLAERTNADWLQALRADPSSEALEDLRAILLRGLRASLASRIDGDLETLTEDFAQDALLKILKNLDTFRGESRFTTWAQKIAIHIALSELRRRRWRDVPLQSFTQNAEGEELTPILLTDPLPQPDRAAAQNDLLRTVEELIFEELTERQRTAMLAILQDGLPLQVIAERMDTNPNALYKLLHDARQRLKQRMEEKTGLSAQELMSLFEAG
ncbi:MAG: sigma-70 family RNA polymerase sigma factor [Anaerolineales bacterium]